VYQLAQEVYKEIDNLFRDAPYIHLGGDEVFGACWDLRPAIKTFMATKGLKDYGELQMYWRYEMKQALPQNRPVVFWRNDAQNVKIADNDIIHFWGAQADIPKSTYL
jgi:hexosaminidase